jgi:hypothetical protein
MEKKDSVELHNVNFIGGDKWLTAFIESEEADFEIPEGYEFDDFELILTIKFKKKIE